MNLYSIWVLQINDIYGNFWFSDMGGEFCLTTEFEEALRFSSQEAAETYREALAEEYISDDENSRIIRQFITTEHGVM
jgi:hypothetical protein